jgi:beta-lactamase class A
MQVMKRMVIGLSLVLCLSSALLLANLVLGQGTGITAEAIGQANFRSIPDIETGSVLGEIFSGTSYPALGRNEFFTWVLLGDVASGAPMGWVFADLVTLRGGTIRDLPFTALDVTARTQPTATATAPTVQAETGVTPVQVTRPAASATPTLPPGIIGVAQGEINVRYGPGVEYTALERAFVGDVFEITATHSQVPWVQVRYPESPTGFAWIARDLLEIQGNVASLPVISQISLNLPELTPTPALRQAITLPGREPVPVSPEFAALGDRIWNAVLEANFVPEGSRFASLYLEDLQTGEAISFNSDIAYSGTSVNKIAVLADFYRTLDGYPTAAEGVDITKTMICSQNTTTNELLSFIGGGGVPSDDYLGGAEHVTDFLRDLGLTQTFLTAPYDARPNEQVEPTAPPRPIDIPQTSAEQTRANPNPANQVTVDEMGLLLSSIYDCAVNESGPLIENFNGSFTPQECRMMVHVMGNNRVDAFIKAGVPEDMTVAHKHGWIADTHTNAAIVFTPGGNYVMVIALYQPETILFADTLPVVANASRAVYNYYNPDRLLDAPREGFIPAADDCPYAPAHPLVNQITDPNFLATYDPAAFSSVAVTRTTTPTPTP